MKFVIITLCILSILYLIGRNSAPSPGSGYATSAAREQCTKAMSARLRATRTDWQTMAATACDAVHDLEHSN
jgi:hypothetical protein